MVPNSMRFAVRIAVFILFCSVTLAFAKEPSMPVSVIPQRQASPSKGSLFLKKHPHYGGTLVLGSLSQPTIINPVLTQYGISASLLELIFDSLVRLDGAGNIVPGLAEKWEISADGKEYTFYLRKGVRFHDGVECTAQDVAFTYRQIMDPKNDSPVRHYFDSVKEVKDVDKYVFQITLVEPAASFLYVFRQEIVPKHLLENKNLAQADFNYHPEGTGPFKFLAWDKQDDRIELAANTDYFEGRPYLDNVIIKAYPDVSQLWSALMRHTVDFVAFIDSEDYKVLAKDPTFKTYAVEGTGYFAIIYNFHDSILSDPDVRKAIAFGLDRKKLIDDLSPGGKECVGPFREESPAFNHDVKPLEFDPVKAKIYLMHRGWQDIDGDGILEKERRKLEIRMLVDERFELYQKLAANIRQQLAQIGVKVKILLYKDESDLTEEYVKKNRPQAWLRLLLGMDVDPNDARDSWLALANTFVKFSHYQNVEIDRLYETARLALDVKERLKAYQEIHRIVYEDQPACFLFYPGNFFAVNAKFKNTNEYFTRHMPNYTIKDWYIDQKTGFGRTGPEDVLDVSY